VKSNREIGGYVLGTTKKIELLQKEGVEIYAGKIKKEYITKTRCSHLSTG